MNLGHPSEAEIFDRAAELSGEARVAYLAQACADDDQLRQRVERLLVSHEEAVAGAFMGKSPVASAKTLLITTNLIPVTEKAGDKIGRYKLREQIGEGGCGVVYVAEQEKPVRRRVALKVIKLGMDTKQVVARFEAERQALALMDHPHIAKVLDAGATDTGRPYFVMELVRGIKITDYCDKNNLSTEERLKLFIQVCSAIQHAHQKGIIHRDIKPSNILVTLHDGVPVPKVIDFGIAKATSDQRLTDKTVYTAFEQFIGTPAYMSPEQAEMSGLDIDTRSDIYSLGVLLYELLTGRTPFDAATLLKAGLDQMRRIICEQEPQRPSTRLSTLEDADLTSVANHRRAEAPKLLNLIRGDLDWIVMKALEKDRTRRYETANGFALDIHRHLTSETVIARPPTTLYRFQRLVRRNKLVFAAGAVVLGVLFFGLGITTWMFFREKAARERAASAEIKALTEAERSAQVAQFMKEMLKGVGPGVALGQDTKLLREILNQTSQRLTTELANQPEVEADLRETLGVVYRDLGEYTNAAAMLQRALTLQRKLHQNEHQSVASVLNNLGQVLHPQGKLPDAETNYLEALRMQRKLFGNENVEVAATLQNLGSVLRRQSKLAEAEVYLRESLEIREKLLPTEHPDKANSLVSLGLLLGAQGKQNEAERYLREGLAIKRKLLPTEHPEIADSLSHLGGTLQLQGRLVEAETNVLLALTMQRKLLGDHRATALTLIRLGSVLTEQNRLAEAAGVLREALAMEKKLLGSDNISGTLKKLSDVLLRQKKYVEAEAINREALENQLASLQQGEVGVMNSIFDTINRLNSLLRDQGKEPLGTAEGVKAIATLRQIRGNNHVDVAAALNRLGRAIIFNKGGTPQEAIPLFREAVWIIKHEKGNEDPDLVDSLNCLGVALEWSGNLTEAEAIDREALAIGEKCFGKEHAAVASSLDQLANTFNRQGRFSEAEPLHRRALTIRRKVRGEQHREVMWSHKNLAWSLWGQNKVDEAVASTREGIAVQKKLDGDDHLNVANALRDLANQLRNHNRLEQATEVFREVVAIERKHSDNFGGTLAWTFESLGSALAQQGKLDKAEAAYREALQIRHELLQEGKREAMSPFLKAVDRLDSILSDQGKATEGLRVIESLKQIHGTNQVEAAALFDELAGMLLWQQNKPAYSVPLSAEALRIRSEMFGQEDSRLVPSLNYLTVALERMGKLDEAEAYGRRAVGLTRKSKPEVNTDTHRALDSLGNVLIRKNQFAEAEQLHHEALGLARKIYGDRRDIWAWSAFHLARSLLAQNKAAEAVPFYREAADLGNTSAQTRLARMYAAGQGVAKDPAEAAKWYTKVAEKDDPQALNDLAWDMATSADSNLRDGTNAVLLAEKAVAKSNRKDPMILDTLAAAYAEASQFTRAVETQKEAVALLKTEKEKDDYLSRLKLYDSGKPYREAEPPNQ